MPRNGSGTFSLAKPPFVPGTTISSSDVNSDFSDIATGLTNSIATDGQTPITGQLKFPSGTALAPSHTFESALDTGMYFPTTGMLGFSAAGTAAVIFDNTRIGTGQDGAILQYGNGAIVRNVGEVTSYAGTNAPSGWFLCYGQAVSRTGYPELFFIISTTYGSGDGTTTFNLPDLRGRAEFGKDNMGGSAANRITTAGSGVDGTTLGAAGGVQSFTITTPNLPAYTPSGSVSISDTRTWITSSSFSVNGGSVLATTSFGVGLTAPTQQSVVVSSGGISGSLTGTAQGGTSTPMATLSPGLILNKIIFAGRP